MDQQTKKKKLIYKGLSLLLVAAILITIMVLPVRNYLPHLWGGPVYPEYARFTIERKIEITTNREINYNVTVPSPHDIEEQGIQKINSVEWNIEPDFINMYGIEWKTWRGSLEDQTKEILINYHVETRSIKWDYSQDISGSVDDFEESIVSRYEGNQWLLEEDRNDDGNYDWMIEPENPVIKNLAEDITRDEETVYGKARAIYDWMVKNIDYERGGPGLPQHSVWTLDRRAGDCDEWSYLYISLARAIGIPAWVELGVLYDRMGDYWGGHGWVRLQFVDEDGNHDWVNIDLVNRQFFARDATRITTWIDDGVEGHLSEYYYYVRYNYTGLPRPSVSISEDYTNVEMETEGEVYIGDELGIPWIPGKYFIIALVISSIYKYAKIHNRLENDR